MNPMAFSVVIPACNASAFIDRAVRSALAQTVLDLEVIVVENGSTDETAQLVEAIEDPRLVLIQQEKNGVSRARNAGIRAAKYDWIAFLDADDAWYPKHLENAQRILTRHTDLRWYGAACERRRADGRLLRVIVARKAADPSGRIPDCCAPNAKQSLFLFSCSGDHREVFNSVGLMNESISRGEDLDMWYRIALKYPAMGYSTEPAGCYYKHPQSAMHMNPERSPADVMRRIMLTLEAATPADAQRLPAARGVASKWLERWIRLCAKAGERSQIAALRRVDPRLLTLRVRLLAWGVQKAPEWLISRLRRRSAWHGD